MACGGEAFAIDLVAMSNVNTERSNAARFEFAFTLLISMAIALTLAVLTAGIGYLVWR